MKKSANRQLKPIFSPILSTIKLEKTEETAIIICNPDSISTVDINVDKQERWKCLESREPSSLLDYHTNKAFFVFFSLTVECTYTSVFITLKS